MNTKTPLDLKIVGVIFALSALSYFSINPDINFILGFKVTGLIAKASWLTLCLLCLIGGYGLWKRNLLIWRVVFILNIYCLLNICINYFFVPANELQQIIPLSELPQGYEPKKSMLFFIVFFCIQTVFLIYLFMRKGVFKQAGNAIKTT